MKEIIFQNVLFKTLFQIHHRILSDSIYFTKHLLRVFLGFPGGSDGKEPVRNAGDPGSIPGLGGSPGEGNGTTLQYSCLENPMDRGAWWATVHGVAQSDMTEQFHFLSVFFLISSSSFIKGFTYFFYVTFIKQKLCAVKHVIYSIFFT